MTTRNDVDVEFFTDPRVAEVRAPSAEITMQDLVDTLRKREDAFSGMTFKKLVNASGKEELGGGVSVGITVAMQNLLLAFAGRTTPAETGTVTSSPANLIAGRQTFVDTSADFVTALVQRGSLVINFSDLSIADVIAVDDLNTLQTKTLVNGTTNTYQAADVYHVFNITQVRAGGGNLTAVDGAQSVINAILPTAFTQVVIELASGTTSIETGVSGLTVAESAQLANIETITLSLQKLMKNRMETNPTTGIMTIYDDDDVTPLLTGNIYEDVLAAQIYRGRGMERRDRLT